MLSFFYISANFSLMCHSCPVAYEVSLISVLHSKKVSGLTLLLPSLVLQPMQELSLHF